MTLEEYIKLTSENIKIMENIHNNMTEEIREKWRLMMGISKKSTIEKNK